MKTSNIENYSSLIEVALQAASTQWEYDFVREMKGKEEITVKDLDVLFEIGRGS